MYKAYAGIGSRRTPDRVIRMMESLGEQFATNYWLLRTGNCEGADQAFQRGANRIRPGSVTLFLPKIDYNSHVIFPENVVISSPPTETALDFVSRFHPRWDLCNDFARCCHVRNAQIILGEEFLSPVQFIVAWTDSPKRGGTSMGFRIAEEYSIPVLNLWEVSDVG